MTESATPATEELVRRAATYWNRVASHPFLRTIAQGNLSDAVFRRWVAADFAFNLEYLRFTAGLLALSPSPSFSRSLVGHLQRIQDTVDLLNTIALEHRIDLGADPGPATLGLSSYLRASLSRGFGVSVVALYCAERVYFEAWSRLRPRVRENQPYAQLVSSLSSGETGKGLSEIGDIVDLIHRDGVALETYIAFEVVIRFELLFWTEVFVGESW